MRLFENEKGSPFPESLGRLEESKQDDRRIRVKMGSSNYTHVRKLYSSWLYFRDTIFRTLLTILTQK